MRPQSLVRRPLAKRARTSDPGESSRAPHPKPLVATHARAPADFELPSNMSPGSIIRHPMLTAPPIEGNSDYKLRHFHSEFYFDQEAFRQKLELRDSYGLLQRYYLEQLMTPREFFYPRVALNFYQSMTTCGVPSPTSIHFTIDGHHGILKAKNIAKALQIPFERVDPFVFRQWSLISQRDMVRILSRGTFTDSILLRQELPPRMLLVDVMLHSKLFPL